MVIDDGDQLSSYHGDGEGNTIAPGGGRDLSGPYSESQDITPTCVYGDDASSPAARGGGRDPPDLNSENPYTKHMAGPGTMRRDDDRR